ncbi:MAG TPA: hypothetical protein QGG47_01200 [Acidobacteriota bacterium]|nr:hypothetical protein [Acidobacteriota bacterium]
MIDLERRIGPLSWRVWGLIANFVGNAVALYGAAGVLRDGSGWPALAVGLAITVTCVLVLAIPSPDPGAPDDG